MSRDLFGVLVLLIQISINIPVIVRLLRVKSGKGISLAGEVVWISGGVGWVIYGVATNSVTLMISGSLAVIGCAATSSLIFKYSRPPVTFALIMGVITMASILVGYLFFGVVGLSIAMAVFGVLQFFPQLFETIGLMVRREDVSGVSIPGSAFRATYTGCWALYAGAWFLWGIKSSEIDYPLLAWGLAGVVVFGLQAIHASAVRWRPEARTELATAQT